MRSTQISHASVVDPKAPVFLKDLEKLSESLRVFRPCPLITPKDAQSSLQMLAISRYGCALRRGREALAFARHKQSSGLFMSGLSLDRTPFERAARSCPKNSQTLGQIMTDKSYPD